MTCIMFLSRNLIDLRVIRQSIRIKNTFADLACNALAVKNHWKNI